MKLTVEKDKIRKCRKCGNETVWVKIRTKAGWYHYGADVYHENGELKIVEKNGRALEHKCL